MGRIGCIPILSIYIIFVIVMVMESLGVNESLGDSNEPLKMLLWRWYIKVQIKEVQIKLCTLNICFLRHKH